MKATSMTEDEHWAQVTAEQERSIDRRGKPAPMEWGERIDADAYFCEPCWRNGDGTGRHPYSEPPCDAAPRGSFDPR